MVLGEAVQIFLKQGLQVKVHQRSLGGDNNCNTGFS